MPRPRRERQDLNEIKLMPEEQFEDALRAVLHAPRERVAELVAEQEAKEKAERAARVAE